MRLLPGVGAAVVTEIESHREDVYATFDELRSLSSEEQSQRLGHEAAAATGHGKRVLELREELTATSSTERSPDAREGARVRLGVDQDVREGAGGATGNDDMVS